MTAGVRHFERARKLTGENVGAPHDQAKAVTGEVATHCAAVIRVSSPPRDLRGSGTGAGKKNASREANGVAQRRRGNDLCADRLLGNGPERSKQRALLAKEQGSCWSSGGKSWDPAASAAVQARARCRTELPAGSPKPHRGSSAENRQKPLTLGFN